MDRKTGAIHGNSDYSRQWNHDEVFRRLLVLERNQDSSGASLPAAGDYFGQNFYLTTTGKWYKWNGTSWDILN